MLNLNDQTLLQSEYILVTKTVTLIFLSVFNVFTVKVPVVSRYIHHSYSTWFKGLSSLEKTPFGL